MLIFGENPVDELLDRPIIGQIWPPDIATQAVRPEREL